jgi:hypothetical protein
MPVPEIPLESERLLLRRIGAVVFERFREHLVKATEITRGLDDALEGCGLLAHIFIRVVYSLDGETDTALALVHLEHAGFDCLANLKDVLHLLDAFLADLGGMDEAIDAST